MVTDKIVLRFIYNLYIKHVTIERSHFWLKGHNLNKLEVHQSMLHTNIKALCLVISDKIFCFLYTSQCQSFDTRGVAIFGPRAII